MIATKFGFDTDLKKWRTQRGANSCSGHIKPAADACLKRLKIDWGVLFHQRRVDSNVPIEFVAGAVNNLIDEGKVKKFGPAIGWKRTSAV